MGETLLRLRVWPNIDRNQDTGRAVRNKKPQVAPGLRPSEVSRNYAFDASFCTTASSVPPPKLECTGVGPPFVTFTAQYLNSGILPTGSSTGLVSMFAAAS